MAVSPTVLYRGSGAPPVDGFEPGSFALNEADDGLWVKKSDFNYKQVATSGGGGGGGAPTSAFYLIYGVDGTLPNAISLKDSDGQNLPDDAVIRYADLKLERIIATFDGDPAVQVTSSGSTSHAEIGAYFLEIFQVGDSYPRAALYYRNLSFSLGSFPGGVANLSFENPAAGVTQFHMQNQPANLVSATEAEGGLVLTFNENGTLREKHFHWKTQSTLAASDKVLIAV